jgi:P27 family predicted phage terminase small subunit
MNQPGQGRKLKPSTILERQPIINLDERIPPCPSWLSVEAKRIWHKEAPPLHKAGLLKYVDGPAFASYCLIRAQLKQAYDELGDKLTYESVNKNGSTYEMPKPQIAIIHKCVELIKSHAAEFGLTPASRARIPSHPEGLLMHKINQTRKTIPLNIDPRSILELPN